MCQPFRNMSHTQHHIAARPQTPPPPHNITITLQSLHRTCQCSVVSPGTGTLGKVSRDGELEIGSERHTKCHPRHCKLTHRDGLVERGLRVRRGIRELERGREVIAVRGELERVAPCGVRAGVGEGAAEGGVDFLVVLEIVNTARFWY